MTSVLGLDCSQSVGWSLFQSANDKAPRCRTKPFPDSWLDDQYGKYFAEVEEWFVDMLTVHQPEAVVFESPLLLSRQENRGSDEQNVRRLVGVVSIIEKVCYQRKVRCEEVNVQVAKSFMGVPGRRPTDMPKAQYKSLMTVAVTEFGYEVADDHQADAVAMALVFFDQLGEG